MSYTKVKSFGKKQKQVLAYIYLNQGLVVESSALKIVVSALSSKALVEVQADRAIITEFGKKVVEAELLEYVESPTKSLNELQALLFQQENPVENKLSKPEIKFLQFISELPRSLSKVKKAEHIIPTLKKRDFLEINGDELRITPLGQEALEQAVNFSNKIFAQKELEAIFLVENKLSKLEIKFLQFISASPRSLSKVKKAKHIIPALKERDFLEINGDELRITSLGQEALGQAPNHSNNNFAQKELEATFISDAKIQKQSRWKSKGEEYLALYKQDLTYQAIGELKGISRERVRQILDKTPGFHAYLEELEQAKIIAEKEKEELAERKWKENSLASKFPERVAELWDYEKNGNLRPEDVPASSTYQEIWLKCPEDGFSWKKKAREIAFYSWERVGTSGCPACAGKTKKPEKRSSLAASYLRYVIEYWDYEKNGHLGLDPEKLTTGSNKRAWFKCPQDGNEWQSIIAATVNQQWSNDNAGCRVCNGTHLRKAGAWGKADKLIEVFPNEVAKYWNYGRNSALKLDPSRITTGSAKKAWFQCPLDNFEWQASISAIANGSWKQGRSGCPICGRGWTIESILQFVASLEHYIPNLTQSERYKIFEQAGVLGTKNAEGLKIVKDVIKGKLKGQKLHDVLQGKKSELLDNTADVADTIDANAELKEVGFDTHGILSPPSQNPENTVDSIEVESADLPTIRVQKSLEFLSSNIVASSDDEAIEFFIASRRNRIWAEVFENQSAVNALLNFSDDGYGRQVRDQFLDEYNQANDMQIPLGWSFRIDGKVTPPNLMQKVAAVRLRNQKRMLNLSLTGTGKTIGGILGSRIIDANLTVIVCPLDTINNWHAEIKHVFPDSKVTIKSFNPYWINVGEGHHYIILNHEMFQQPSTASDIRQLLERYKIDLIIVDEIHRCKQRSDDPSKRRQMVLALITNAAEINPDLHVLGMSATPIINNLREGKSLVELVTGIERSDLGEKATINNCMRLHQAFVSFGIRSRVKPKIKINRITIPVDCTDLVDEIRENGTSVLKMEQILTSARIPIILSEIRPKTIVYTHYVDGIVEQLKQAIEAEGWSVGFHMGGDKSGRESFINGSTDVLIASSAMAVGVDGFQKVCDRLILNIPPWTSAELEQLEGRLNRQGQVHESLTIIFPVTFGEDGDERWSWDEGRLARLQNKQTIADAAVDGVMPEGQLRTEAQAFRDLRGWLDRLKVGEQRSIVRPRIFVPLPDSNVTDVKRRNAKYGDFSRMNARWNSSYSSTTYQRLQKNPEEWMQYHTLYQEARKTWEIIPYQETIKWLEKRSNLVVGDFGCGEALISKSLADKHTIHNFDFIAINESVIECDFSSTPLEDACLDVAIFNLSLMGRNIADYIREANRTLKLDGQLLLYELESHFKDLEGFIRGLAIAGFDIIENRADWKFRFIRAIKSAERIKDSITISL
ncbi:MAG: DEAD/DEAH box helicase family protein [Acidobacteria bacterium]|nr:DEAD/DEAH box helicase family protein [Acidobacteriota bacterium]